MLIVTLIIATVWLTLIELARLLHAWAFSVWDDVMFSEGHDVPWCPGDTAFWRKTIRFLTIST